MTRLKITWENTQVGEQAIPASRSSGGIVSRKNDREGVKHLLLGTITFMSDPHEPLAFRPWD